MFDAVWKFDVIWTNLSCNIIALVCLVTPTAEVKIQGQRMSHAILHNFLPIVNVNIIVTKVLQSQGDKERTGVQEDGFVDGAFILVPATPTHRR